MIFVGKHPLKFYLFLLLSIASIIGISFANLGEAGLLKIILVIGAPALFFAFCIDSAAKVKRLEIKDSSIYFNLMRWHGFQFEELELQKKDIKRIFLGSNGYTIEIETKLDELKFDARFMKDLSLKEGFETPANILKILNSGQ